MSFYFGKKKTKCFLQDFLVQDCLREGLNCTLINYILKVFKILIQDNHDVIHLSYKKNQKFFVNLISDIIQLSLPFLNEKMTIQLNCVFYYYEQTLFFPILLNKRDKMFKIAAKQSILKKNYKTHSSFDNLFIWFGQIEKKRWSPYN